MKAAILAAEKGERRLKPLTNYTPKAMLPIGNRLPILHLFLNLNVLSINNYSFTFMPSDISHQN